MAASTPKRFVLLSQHFYPEMVSTGIHMTELATRLAELGWQVTVYSAAPAWGSEWDEAQPVPKELVYEGVKVLRVPTVGRHRGSLLSRGLFAVSFVLSVGWALWRGRAEYPAIVITTDPPFLGIIGWLFSRLFKRPYLLIVYDIYPDIVIKLGISSTRSWFIRAWRWMTRVMLIEAAVIVVIGRDMAEVVRGKVPSSVHERIVLIPNWSDERRVQPVPREANGFRQAHTPNVHFVVQYAGRLGRTHNVEPLIDAARRLNGNGDTTVMFQFIGDGAKKGKLEALAAEHGVDNIQFLPYQRMEDLPEMLSAADLAVVCLDSPFTGVVVPSKTYGILASGTPVLGLLDPTSEIGQMIIETGCGIVVDSDPAHIASAIRELIADSTRRLEMGRAGRQAFLDKYTLEHATRAYDAALSAMLNGSNPR